MLVGTATGLVDPLRHEVVAFAGRDVVAATAAWAVLDGREVHALVGDAAAPSPGARLTCVGGAPQGPALVGTAEAHLYRLADGLERVEGFERVEGRHDWYTPWGGPPDVRSVSVGPTGTVLVNVHVGGIARSTDGGDTWRPTIEIHADVHQVLALDGGVAVAACAEGLATSDDDGATWTIHDGALHATYSRAVAVAGDVVLFGVADGPGGGAAALYRRPLAGGSPERVSGGLPADLGGNVDTFRLAGDPDGAAALVTVAGDVYASTDEGSTWDHVASVPGVRCLLLG